MILLLHLAFTGSAMLQHTSHPTLAQVSDLTGMSFPHSTRLVASQAFTWQGTELWARLEMDRSEVTAFVRQERLAAGDHSSTDRFGLTDSRRPAGISLGRAGGWWHPDAIQRFAAAESKDAPRVPNRLRTVRVLVDTSPAGSRATVYLYSIGGS